MKRIYFRSCGDVGRAKAKKAAAPFMWRAYAEEEFFARNGPYAKPPTAHKPNPLVLLTRRERRRLALTILWLFGIAAGFATGIW